ncbi:MAG: hypothetical protein ABSH39_21010 [Candidatus Acidiferrum sp.]|jgi:hypothetical protein
MKSEQIKEITEITEKATDQLGHYTKMLRQPHAPEMAKAKPLLGRSWTPTGGESGTLVHRVVN